MASTTDTPVPPPYTIHDELKDNIPYQQQVAPPPQLGYYAAPPPSIPVYTQTTFLQPVIGSAFIGRNPVAIQCPRCQQQIVTVVQYENGGGTWLIALLICLFGGIFGCCLIPFCVPGCQDTIHTCPACQNLIGRRNVF
ncbi:hypothetical protein I4U23_010303 [Adineta vaga]|nr:hypothetical protein I4U23_010303 [Adineta vaga]